jgi:hypothetical protein
MRYFALGNKATFKISDENIKLEDVIKDAIKNKIITPEEAHQVKEIKRDEFVKPMDEFIPKKKEIVYEDTDYGPVASWQSLIDSLKTPNDMEKSNKKRYNGK